MQKQLIKKSGFTLAEVLITLGVIGVVASMTMPTLITNHQEKVLITQNKVAYSTVLQALQKVQSENEFWMDTIFTPGNSNFESAKAFKKYFKGARHTGKQEKYYIKPMYPVEGDDGKNVKQSMGKDRIELNNGVYIDVLQYTCQEVTTYEQKYNLDGSMARDEDGNLITVPNTTKKCATLVVDVNGIKKPNQMGRDCFAMDVSDTGWKFYKTVWYGDIQSIVSEEKFSDKIKDYNLDDDFGK